jgi:mutator protein MutT
MTGAPTPVPPRVIEVSAGLVFHRGKLLITQRRPQDHLGGLWEFPGGKREPGESYEQCLERELQEELGIAVVVGELIETVDHAYPEKTVHLRFFCCALRGDSPSPEAIGCHALAWVEASELGRFQFPAADTHLLELLRMRPAYWG